MLPVKMWEEHLLLRELVEKIRQHQAGKEKPSHTINVVAIVLQNGPGLCNHCME